MSTVPKKQTGLLCKHCCAVKIGICQTVMRHELIFPIPMNWNPWGWPGDKSMLSMMLWVAPFDLCHLKPSQKIGTLVDRPTEHCSFVVRCKALRHVLLAAFIPKLSCRPAFEGQSFEPSCRLSSNCMVNTWKETCKWTMSNMRNWRQWHIHHCWMQKVLLWTNQKIFCFAPVVRISESCFLLISCQCDWMWLWMETIFF